jgi:transcription antitermination factor NusG
MALTENASWFIVNTKPKQEFIAEKNLKLLGIDVYLPIYLKKVKKDKSKIDVIAALFSGYLFSRFSIPDFYHKVKYTRGVKMVLGNKDYLWTIDQDRVMDIKSREKNGVVILKKRIEHFRKGDRITIDEGSFDGWEGIFFEELPDRERAIIMLTNVKFSSKLIVPKKYLILNR